MCKFIGKSNERILCKLSKSEILRLHSIVHVAMETTKMANFTCQSKSGADYCQNLLSVYFSLAKFQLVSGNPSLAIICQMTYTHKLSKLCSATLRSLSVYRIYPPKAMDSTQWVVTARSLVLEPPLPSSSFYLSKKGQSVFQPYPKRMEGVPYLEQR